MLFRSYLANYNLERFNFLLNWIGAIFKNPFNKSLNTLVLFGENNSGINFLFNDIISPLVGEQNCLKIDSKLIKYKSINTLIANKLFYNFHNIQCDSKTNEFSYTQAFYQYQDEMKFGQKLITTNLVECVDKDLGSVVFKMEKDIYKTFNKSHCDILLGIEDDLENFASFLNSIDINMNIFFDISNKDDRNILESTLQEKLNIFNDYLKNFKAKSSIDYFSTIQNENQILYDELVADFEKSLIKQKNIIKCINILYKDILITNKALWKELREIDPKLYGKNSLLNITGNKYIKIL